MITFTIYLHLLTSPIFYEVCTLLSIYIKYEHFIFEVYHTAAGKSEYQHALQ